MGGQSVKRRKTRRKKKTEEDVKRVLLPEFGVSIHYTRLMCCDMTCPALETMPQEPFSAVREFEQGDTTYVTIKLEIDRPPPRPTGGRRSDVRVGEFPGKVRMEQ